MIEKKLNSNGQKAYQRTDFEDRSLPYRNWIRTIDSGGFFCDVDFIKWRKIDGVFTPVAVTDLTRCDSLSINEKYLDAVIKRFFIRDAQGEVLTELGKRLDVPVYLVLFQKDLIWIYAYSFRQKKWKKFNRVTWGDFLKKL